MRRLFFDPQNSVRENSERIEQILLIPKNREYLNPIKYFRFYWALEKKTRLSGWLPEGFDQ